MLGDAADIHLQDATAGIVLQVHQHTGELSPLEEASVRRHTGEFLQHQTLALLHLQARLGLYEAIDWGCCARGYGMQVRVRVWCDSRDAVLRTCF